MGENENEEARFRFPWRRKADKRAKYFAILRNIFSVVLELAKIIFFPRREGAYLKGSCSSSNFFGV